MIYEATDYDHTFTVEMIEIPVARPGPFKNVTVTHWERRWKLTVFDRYEQIVYETLCTGIAQAEGYVAEYILGYAMTVEHE